MVMAKSTACKEDIRILMLLWPECVGDVLVIKKQSMQVSLDPPQALLMCTCTIWYS